MKATGIVCRIDNLGRIVIPKENRRPGGFSKYVTQQISMMSNMRTYTENFGNIEKRNALYAQLSNKPESVHTHMVAIDCTWSQRAYKLNSILVGITSCCYLRFPCIAAPFEADRLSADHSTLCE